MAAIVVEVYKPGDKKLQKLVFPLQGLKKGGHILDLDEKKEEHQEQEAVSTLPLYLEDNIADFKAKIALSLKIPIFKQHLYVPGLGPLGYKIADSPLINIEETNMTNSILGMPIDDNLYYGKDSLILTTSESQLLQSFYSSGITTFRLASLDDFISEEALRGLLNQDPYQFQMVYYGFIIKFWPMLSEGIFEAYIRDAGEMNNYPDMGIPDSRIWEKQVEILQAQHQNTKKFPLESTVRKVEMLLTSVSLNIRALFQELPLSSHLPLTRLVDGELIFTKLNKDVFDRLKTHLGGEFAAAMDLGDDLFLIIEYRDGKLFINSAWSDELPMNLESTRTMIQKEGNVILGLINKLGRAVIEDCNRLPLLETENLNFSNLGLSIFWKAGILPSQFAYMGSILREHAQGGLISLNAESQVYEFYFKKGVEAPAWEGYDYLHLSKAKQAWISTQGRLVRISHRTTDVKVEVDGLKEEELDYFYLYLNYLFSLVALHKGEKMVVRKPNRLKILKNKDPELYVFRYHGSDTVYSRICQKEHQPLIYDEEEFESLDARTRKAAIKYWNFTSKRPMFYLCPNPKYPHLSFLVGRHPKGYCLPCCKKTKFEGANLYSKKDQIYKVCLAHHVYEEEAMESNSRYIMNYGKNIEPGRIGFLPDMMLTYLKYNMEDKDVILDESTPKQFVHRDRLYRVEVLTSLVKSNKTRYLSPQSLWSISNMPLSTFQVAGKYSLQEILANPSLDSGAYALIQKSDTSPILLYKEDSRYYLVEGIYRLGKMLLLKRDIAIKLIGAAQLEKAALVSGGGNRKSDLYIYGISQNTATCKGVGALLALSAALETSPAELAEGLLKHIQEKDYFHRLVGGKLPIYFTNYEEFLRVLENKFVNEAEEPHKFNLWNEVFMELVKWCREIDIMVIDDLTVDISGTSMKTSVDRINLWIPSYHTQYPQVILLLRRKKKSRRSEDVYYPIFVLRPQQFFKDLQVDTRIHQRSDEIVTLFTRLLGEKKESWKEVEFLSRRWGISESYYNSQNYCYGVLLRDISLFWPLNLQDFAGEGKIKETYSRKTSGIEIGRLYEALGAYNQEIIIQSEKARSFRVSPLEGYTSPWNKRANRIAPLSPLITVDKFLVLGSKVIGLRGGGKYFYCREFDYHPKKISKVLAKMLRGYVLWEDGILQKPQSELYLHLRYDPDHLNQALLRESKPDPLVDRLPSAMWKRYAYHIALLSFLGAMGREIPEDEKDARREIEKVLSQIAVVGKEKVTDFSGPIPCAPGISYCKGNKLILSSSRYRDYLDLLVADFTNPYKRPLLLQAKILRDNNYFSLNKKLGEEIYIKYG